MDLARVWLEHALTAARDDAARDTILRRLDGYEERLAAMRSRLRRYHELDALRAERQPSFRRGSRRRRHHPGKCACLRRIPRGLLQQQLPRPHSARTLTIRRVDCGRQVCDRTRMLIEQSMRLLASSSPLRAAVLLSPLA